MWGNEMNLDVDAWEAGLGSFIRMKKKVSEIGSRERRCTSILKSHLWGEHMFLPNCTCMSLVGGRHKK